MRLRLTYLGSLCCCAAVLAGCSKSDSGTTDTAAPASAAATPPASPAPIALADVAGKWNVRAVPESGDTTPTMSVITMSGDTTGWTMAFEGRPPVALRVVSVGGDSIATESVPYSSARRKGVMVVTRTVLRREGDRLVGRSVARYDTKGADSMLVLRTEATRAP